MKKVYLLSLAFGSILYIFPSGVCATEDSESQQKTITFHKMSESVDTFRITLKGFKSHDGNKQGNSIGGKLAIQPIAVGKFDIGGYARFSNGNSKKANDRGWQSRADWEVVGGGLSTIYNHDNGSESMLELGILHQRTDVDAPEWGYTSLQKEWQWEMRARHSFTMNMFDHAMYSEFGGEFIDPFHLSFTDSDGNSADNAYNNTRLSMWWRTNLYNFYLDDEKHVRLTPTLNIGGGYLWGKDSGYASIGPGMKFAWFEQEMVEVFVSSRWLFSGDGRYIGGIDMHPYDLYLAVRASQIHDYEAKNWEEE